MDASQGVLDYVARLPTGAHAAFFYEDEEMARQVFSSYARSGITRNEQIYFISMSMEDEKKFLKFNVEGSDPLPIQRVAHIPMLDFCFEEGRLSWKKAKREILAIRRRDGGPAARVIVLADQFLGRASGDEVDSYEKEWGPSLNIPLSALCGYDSGNLAAPNRGDLLIDLCKSHGHLVFKALSCAKDMTVDMKVL